MLHCCQKPFFRVHCRGLSEKLSERKCVNIPTTSKPLHEEGWKELQKKVHSNWAVVSGTRLERKYKTKNFVEAVSAIEKIKVIAEEQDHHPDVHLTDYNNLRISFWTHTVGGLSTNDFICAAKLDEVLQ